MVNLLLPIIIIIAGKILINCYKYIQTKLYLKKYQKYIEDSVSDKTDNTWHYLCDKSTIIALFKGANVKDNHRPFVEEVAKGYGSILINQARFSIFDNLFSTRVDVVENVIYMFHEAIGVYRTRMIESVNPIYWLELIIFLPKKVLEYLNVQNDFTKKLLLVIYWLIVWPILYIFQEEITSSIKVIFFRQPF